MKLLVAYDGSEHAKAAVRDLRRAGIPRESTVLVTTVGDLPVSAVGSPSLDPTIARRPGALLAQTQSDALLSLSDAEQVAKEGAVLVADVCNGSAVTTHVRLGKPADVIIDSADAFGADLIVVGAHGRSALGRLLLGSVSQHVATKSTRSVLVARRVVERGANPVRIIVGIDGSPASHAAVEAVAKRDWSENTEVRLVAIAGTQRANSVAKRVPTAAAWIDESNRSQRDTARAVLEHSMGALAAVGLRVSEHFAEGGVQWILNEHAAEFDADCIFVSGGSFSGDLPLGTADAINALVTSAPCSVEIVR
jgi:nucleotide-binding universal stress UspA family protein